MSGQLDRRGEWSDPASPPASSGDPTAGNAAPRPDQVAGTALGRFGTDRLGVTPHESDRLQALSQRTRTPERRLYAALRADAGRTLANWVVRIANLPVYRARPDLGLSQLMHGLPELLHAVLRVTATTGPRLEPDPTAHAIEILTAHARRRAALGFPVSAVLAELRELHAELLHQLWRLVDETNATEEPGDPAITTTAADELPRGIVERLAITMGDLGIAAAEAASAGDPLPTAEGQGS